MLIEGVGQEDILKLLRELKFDLQQFKLIITTELEFDLSRKGKFPPSLKKFFKYLLRRGNPEDLQREATDTVEPQDQPSP